MRTADGHQASTQHELEAGRLLFAQDCQFVAGAASVASLPEFGLPEVAFAGRSNVGKSSLVNALTGRLTLAKVSSRPGLTRQINFFALGHRLMLVDLPGYGFAQVGKALKQSWQDLAAAYLRGRPTLQRICLLIDARHGLKDIDRDTMKSLDRAAVVYQLVLTKADTVKGPALQRIVEQTTAALRHFPAAHPEVMVTSASEGIGIAEMRAELERLAAPRQAVRS